MDLDELREKLDEIDKQMVELYEKRIETIKEVAYYKIKVKKPVLDKTREKEKIKQVISLLENPSNSQGIEKLYTAIMEESREIQSLIITKHKLEK